jgi:DNA uptake protein ComE-like DNA-binding protein
VAKPRGLWVLLTFVPFGWGNWLAFLVAGVKARKWSWLAWSPVYVALMAAPFVIDAVSGNEDDGDAIAGLVMFGGWFAGIAHAFLVRPTYVRRLKGTVRRVEAARERLAAREEALRLAREQPAVALEMGIGRPDRPGAHDGGVVDVNNAAYEALQTLSGFDRKLARRVVALREELDGFSSLEDLGMTLDLPADVVEDLRGRVVFLPR